VYSIVESQQNEMKSKAGFQWESPLVKTLHSITEGKQALELIVEFLQFFKLDYTLQVFRKEVSL